MTDETYVENGRLFYRASGNRVWPRRNRQFPSAKPGDEQHKKPLIEDSLVKILLEQLDGLEKKTRPSCGEETAAGKDYAAFHALHVAGDLIRYIAGWAIDHQIGLATKGMGFVALGTSQTTEHPDYLEEKRKADSHEHERVGGSVKALDPAASRAALINLLLANPGGFPDVARHPAIEALEALAFEEVLPMLAPAKGNRKVKLVESRLQLQVIGFLEFQKAAFGHGAKYEAIETASRVLEIVGTDAIRGWEYRLRKELGQLTVTRTLSRYSNMGRSYKVNKERWAAGDKEAKESADMFEEKGGLPALQMVAEKYRHLKRVKKD
jgi:hypothetical protein